MHVYVNADVRALGSPSRVVSPALANCFTCADHGPGIAGDAFPPRSTLIADLSTPCKCLPMFESDAIHAHIAPPSPSPPPRPPL